LIGAWPLIVFSPAAQGKPPLIQMNAMSALYQIPTADPPTLDSPDGWSDKFKMFIAQCLVKDPDARDTADRLLVWIAPSEMVL
jgi:serine/threonine protein kinase